MFQTIRGMAACTIVLLIVLLFSVSLCVASSPLHEYNSDNPPIPDNGTKVCLSVTTSGAPAGATITKVTLRYRIEHPRPSDLQIWWTTEYPSGSWHDYPLPNTPTKTGEIDRTIYDITKWNGLPPNLTWYLCAKDLTPGYSGNMDYMGIWVYYAVPSIDSAYWDPSGTVQAGTTVTMRATTTGLDGEQATFDIYESDGIWGKQYINTKTGIVANGRVSAPWKTVYVPDPFPGEEPPEYLFRVTIAGEERDSDDNLKVPDNMPPTPDPMTFSTAPYAASSTSIRMVATAAEDPNGVEYYFDCYLNGGGGDDLDWTTSRDYRDYDLNVNTRYGYRVKARDKMPTPIRTPMVY